jgi:hypothetical protein
VSYSYQWQGQEYAGTAPGTFVLGGSSEVDDWDERMEQAIVLAQQGEKPFSVWSIPTIPSESMVDNEIRWKLLLVALRSGGLRRRRLAAFFLIGRNALGFRSSGRQRAVVAAQTRKRSSQWAVAIVWNGVALPIALVAIPACGSAASGFRSCCSRSSRWSGC